MKKFLTLVLALAIIFSFAACGNKTPQPTQAPQTTEAPQTTQAP